MTVYEADALLDALREATTWDDGQIWDNLDAILTVLALWESA